MKRVHGSNIIDNVESSPPIDASIWANLPLDFQLKLLDHFPLQALFRAKLVSKSWRQGVLSLCDTRWFYICRNKMASPGEKHWRPLPLDYLPNFPEQLLRVRAATSTGWLLVETMDAQLIVTNFLTRSWTGLPPLDSHTGTIISFQAFPDSSFWVVYGLNKRNITMPALEFPIHDTLELHIYYHCCGAAEVAAWESWVVDIGAGQILASLPMLGFCSDESHFFFITRTSLGEKEYSLKSVSFLDRDSGTRTLARWKSLPPGFMVSDKRTSPVFDVYPLPVVCGGRILFPCMQTSSGGDRGVPALLLLDERLGQWQPFVAMPLDDPGLVPREILNWELLVSAGACEDEVVFGLLAIGFLGVYKISSRTWSPLPLPDCKRRSLCSIIPFKYQRIVPPSLLARNDKE
ncbi:hypothetical protein SELMODRAFT_414851 [Selaginella moellendorffii]|uniref:F-box domain-containing protein n=1 Tax=Selaginella moellendorffii TaxID=88036 RepID=D8RUU8_SELML|nr:hypothetical protein SELMODRAFT_414851 [Selaginella moellendorffii]